MFRLTRKTTNNKLVGGALAFVFLSVMFFGLFHMPVGIDMADNMSGCPFMTHEATLCSMSVFDHIKAWEDAFLSTIPTNALLFLGLVGAIYVLSFAPNLPRKQTFRTPLLSRDFVERVYSFSYRPLQELFSNGILHPKLF